MIRQDKLKNFKPAKEFFVGIDSDGCVFDTMGIKQRECFCPWMIAYFGLQPVAQAARECKEFADLFSKTRGANRHKTIKLILSELLPSHPMVKTRNFKVPQYPYYFAWVDDPKSLLSDSGLKQAISSASNPDAKRELELVLQWSERVNWSVKEIVKGIPPFPFVKESLQKLQKIADVIVVSATPTEALQREWEEHDIAKYAAIIAGQEMGTKKEAKAYDKGEAMTFYSADPVVSFYHPFSCDELTRKRKKIPGPVQAFDIPYWGRADKVRRYFR